MPSSDLVTFRGGFTASTTLVLRLLDLEGRGAAFHLLDDGRFQVDPPAVLTDDDRQFLRAHRDAVRACLDYVEQQPAEVPL